MVRCLLVVLACSSGCYIISAENARQVRAALEDRARLQRENVVLRDWAKVRCSARLPSRLIIQMPSPQQDAGASLEPDADIPLRLP